MYSKNNCLPGLLSLLAIAVTAANPLASSPVLHDRIREAAPAGSPYQWIEYYTGGAETAAAAGECITLNAGAHLVLSGGNNYNNSNNALEKRSGAHTFTAYSSPGCTSGFIASTSGWGCVGSNCYNWGTAALSTRLTQDSNNSPYPTADLHNAAACSDGREHHQGIDGTESCDDASFYGSDGWQSTELWYDC